MAGQTPGSRHAHHRQRFNEETTIVNLHLHENGDDKMVTHAVKLHVGRQILTG